MAKLQDKMFNRVIEGKLVAQQGDELPSELPEVSASDNGKALVVSGGKWVAGAVSGGTKLYRHSIVVDFQELTLISESPSSLVGRSIISVYPDCIVMKYSFDENQIILGTDGSTIIYYIQSGVLSNTEFSNTEITADEITPL